MAMENASAGPSKVPLILKKKVSNFLSDSDRSDGEDRASPSPSPAKIAKSQNGSNGAGATNGAAVANGKKRKAIDGLVQGKGKRPVNGSLRDEGGRARKVEADRLFESRQQLPFYQGDHGPLLGQA